MHFREKYYGCYLIQSMPEKNCNSSYGLISVIKVYGALKYIRILAHLCIWPAYAWYAIIEIERVKVDRSWACMEALKILYKRIAKLYSIKYKIIRLSTLICNNSIQFWSVVRKRKIWLFSFRLQILWGFFAGHIELARI